MTPPRSDLRSPPPESLKGILRVPGGAASGPAQPDPQRLLGSARCATLILLALAGAARADGIYTCTDDRGRKLTSDRPIAECLHKEQLLLNRDGSLRSVIPATLTVEERAEREARERRAAEARAAQFDAVRRDRNLTMRFPNEAAHGKAREAALDGLRQAIAATEQRLKELAAERAPLVNEAEFYKGRPMPAKLKQQLDANDAALDAQQNAAANQTTELDRVNKIYDAELERLRRLWNGAPPGSLGPMPAAAPPPAASRPASRVPRGATGGSAASASASAASR